MARLQKKKTMIYNTHCIEMLLTYRYQSTNEGYWRNTHLLLNKGKQNESCMLREMHDPFMARGKVPAKFVKTWRENPNHTHFIKYQSNLKNIFFFFTKLSIYLVKYLICYKVWSKRLKIRIKKEDMALISQRNGLCSIYFSQNDIFIYIYKLAWLSYKRMPGSFGLE